MRDSAAARRFYDRISGLYDVIADASEHAVRDQGIRALSLEQGERVLEIGYGTGHGLVAIAEAVGPSGRVYGVDISGGMAAVAQRRVAWRHRGRVWLVQGDARMLCFGANVLDAVFFSFSLELLGTEIPSVLAEAKRLLRSGGRIGIVGMAESADAGAATEVYLWLHRVVPHLVDCAPIDIGHVVADAGFEIQSVAASAIWTLPVAVVVGRKLRD